MGMFSVKNMGDMRVPANELQGWMQERKAERDAEEERNFMGFVYDLISTKTDPNASPQLEDVIQMAQRRGIDPNKKPELIQKAMGEVKKYEGWAREKTKWQQSQKNAEDINNAKKAIYNAGNTAERLTGAMNLATALEKPGEINDISKTLDEMTNPATKAPVLGTPEYNAAKAAEKAAILQAEQANQDPNAKALQDLNRKEKERSLKVPIPGSPEDLARIDAEEGVKAKYRNDKKGEVPGNVKEAQDFVVSLGKQGLNPNVAMMLAFNPQMANKPEIKRLLDTQIPQELKPLYDRYIEILNEYHGVKMPTNAEPSAPAAQGGGVTHEFVPGKGLVPVVK